MVIVLSIDNKKAGEVKLPDAFSQQLNEKVLKRAYLAEESENFQLKYPDPLAGMRKSAELTKRRRSYKTTYGGNTRTPKKTLQHVGSHFSYVGAVAPNTVGGREAHPPKAERRLVKKINKQERQLAIRIGIAGSAKKELVSKFHKIDGLNELPLVLEDKINVLEKTKDALKVLAGVGLSVELDRVMKRSIRAGKGKLRGRKYKRKLGIVLVTTDDSKLKRAVSNLNVMVKKVNSLSVSDVSQAGKPGRLVVWTKSALEGLK